MRESTKYAVERPSGPSPTVMAPRTVASASKPHRTHPVARSSAITSPKGPATRAASPATAGEVRMPVPPGKANAQRNSRFGTSAAVSPARSGGW